MASLRPRPVSGNRLIPRASDTADQFLCLISSPFAGSVGADAVIASLVASVVLASAMALLFCFLRPYNSVVYAPRAKHADSKHAPPPASKHFLGWVAPVLRTKEQELVEKVGLDAAVFIRISKMMRNIFVALTVIGCGILIPVNVVGANLYHTTRKRDNYGSLTFGNVDCQGTLWQQSSADEAAITSLWLRMTPFYMYGGRNWWAYVVIAYMFDFTIMFFLWVNYRAVLRLRRAFFNSPDYQQSLHARTLILTDIPKKLRSDDGIVRVVDETKATSAIPRPSIARNVKDLPELVEEHEETVKELEAHLAKYLKNPERLPLNRPTTKASKNDKAYTRGQKVDAIEYLTARIRQLEIEIQEVRESVDKRNALSYGFASYDRIAEAHGVAYAARKKAPEGTIVKLAPKPNDLVWKNLRMSRRERATQNVWNSIWIGVLTVVWIVPNILIAVFLSNISHIVVLAPGFAQNFYKYHTWWAIVQGVAAPAITTLFYFYLPAIFRKLSMNAGDTTKTSRERHVMRALYSFFTFNNLIVFSFFSVIFTWIAVIIKASNSSNSVWQNFLSSDPLGTLVIALCQLSPYWISWTLQRNLGAAVDLSQLITLTWGSFSRKFLSPTPRQLIELTAPQPFDYAGYYNYYLFCATVAMAFAGIQPLVLPVTAFYFGLDAFFKKYLILYVFITKYESGGMFWRPVFNRVLFLTLLGNVFIALIIAGRAQVQYNWNMLAALVPLPLIILAFKIYCSKAFDDQLHYYHMGQTLLDPEELAMDSGFKKSRKGDRVGVRFGHPVLYKPLITPMVSAKSQHLLKQVYSGRTSSIDRSHNGGFSDVHLDNMDGRHPGKSRRGPSGFEFVSESDMDFENYKNRPEFQAGGDGVLYGRAEDMVRPGTPGSSIAGFTRAGTWDSDYGHGRADSFGSGKFIPGPHSRSESGESDTTKVGGHPYSTYPGGDGGVEYPRGYHAAGSGLRDQSPAGSDAGFRRPDAINMPRDGSRERLVSTAAFMGRSTPGVVPAPTPGGYGPIHTGGGFPTPGSASGEEETSYDYFRRGRTQGR